MLASRPAVGGSVEAALAEVLGASTKAAPAAANLPRAFAHVLLEYFDFSTSSMVPKPIQAMPSLQKTAFYDASTAVIKRDEPLQTALTDLVEGKAAYKTLQSNLAIALVDLSGDKFAPRYAGINDASNFYSGSVAKICGLLAAYQLAANINVFLGAGPPIASMGELETEIDKEWNRLGVSKDRPAVSQVLQFHAGSPPTVTLRTELLSRFDAISAGNENGSTAVVLLRFPFIASTMLAHGLFSRETKSGLWLNRAYGPIHYPTSADPERSIPNWSASAEDPFPAAPVHCVSAIAAAQFFTLAAQGRLIGAAASQAILRHLRLDLGGCADAEPDLDLTALQSTGVISAKCGFYEDVWHIPLYFKHSTSEREFVVVILTSGHHAGVVKELFADLVALV